MVRRIREQFNRIEIEKPSYRTEARSLRNDEGEVYDTAKVYYSGNAVKAVRTGWGSEDSYQQVDLYIVEDHVVFAFGQWNSVNGGAAEYRYYFNADTLYRATKTVAGAVAVLSDNEASSGAEAILREAARYIRSPDVASPKPALPRDSIQSPQAIGLSPRTVLTYGQLIAVGLLGFGAGVAVLIGVMRWKRRRVTSARDQRDSFLAQSVAKSSKHSLTPGRAPVGDRAGLNLLPVIGATLMVIGAALPWARLSGAGGAKRVLGLDLATGVVCLVASLASIGAAVGRRLDIRAWLILLATTTAAFKWAEILRLNRVSGDYGLGIFAGTGLMLCTVTGIACLIVCASDMAGKRRASYLACSVVALVSCVGFSATTPADRGERDTVTQTGNASRVEAPACSQEDAERTLEARAASTSPMGDARLGRSTQWQASGPCSWTISGVVGWRDAISNQPAMYRFVAAVAGRGGQYSVDMFQITGSYP